VGSPDASIWKEHVPMADRTPARNEATARSRSGRRAGLEVRDRVLLVAAGMASLLDSAAIVSVASALPLWRSTFDLNDLLVGVVSGAMTLSIAVGALVGGRLSDRGSRTRVFSISLVVYAAGAVVVAAAVGTTQLIVGVVILGAAGGADLPASIALIADHAPLHTRARMVAATQVMWTLGVLVASALALVVAPYGTTGMRWVFLGLGALAVASVLVRWRSGAMKPGRLVESARTSGDEAGAAPESEVDRSGAADVLRISMGHRREIVLVGAFYVLFTLVASTFGNFRTYVLVVTNELAQTTATAVGFAATLIGLCGTVVFSAAADTHWRARTYPFGAVLLVVSPLMLAATGAERVGWTVAALVVFSLAHPFVGEALYKVWSQERIPAPIRATTQGVTIAAARVAAAGFALVTPALLSHSATILFGIVAVFAVAAVVVGRRVGRLPGE